MEEYTSSFTSRSDRTIASSKLCPYHGMNATSTFAPSASSPRSVPAPPGHHDGAGVARHLLLEPRAHERRLGEEERHRLPLHVRSHERAVGVVVLEERDQRGSDRHELLRRHVHEIDLVR